MKKLNYVKIHFTYILCKIIFIGQWKMFLIKHYSKKIMFLSKKIITKIFKIQLL